MRKKDLSHRIEVLFEARDYWQREAVAAQEREIVLARWLMSEWVHVNESKVEELDSLLEQYYGGRL